MCIAPCFAISLKSTTMKRFNVFNTFNRQSICRYLICTLKRNILVKTRQDLDNKLYCRRFGLTSFFWTVCLHNEQNT